MFGFFCSNGTDVRHLSVYLGKTAINDTDPEREQRFTVEKLIIHPHFDDYSNNNDIGVCSFNLCLMIWSSGLLCIQGLIAVFFLKKQHC